MNLCLYIVYIPGWVDYLPTYYVREMLDFIHNNVITPKLKSKIQA